MEVRICWLSTNLNLLLKASPLMWFAQCCRPGWRRRVIVGVLIFCFCVIFAAVTHSSVWGKYLPRQPFRRTAYDKNTYLNHRRKSSWDNLNTRNVRLSSDYGDPLQMDLSFDKVQNTAETYSKSGQKIEARDLSYGIVIDCGSSGSRVFVYYWPKHSGDPNELLRIQQLLSSDGTPVVKKIVPGIATYAYKPKMVGSYIEPLLNYASQYIPPEKQKETPLYVLCTAGMRMLSRRLQQAILDNLHSSISKFSAFQFLPSYAEVISGMTEGLYFWMGLNYALGNLNQEQHYKHAYGIEAFTEANVLKSRMPTVGVVDMGGGSLQIAFEISNQKTDTDLSKQTMEINLGCDEHKSEHEYRVFVETFLHKGGNAVRKTYETDIHAYEQNNESISNTVIQDPCLSLGYTQQIASKTSSGAQSVFYLNGTGDFRECRRRLVSYLDKADCDDTSFDCILDGRTMPSINYKDDQFFGSSEFFYCMDDVLQIGGIYDRLKYENKAMEYCSTPWGVTWSRYEDGFYKRADENRLRFQCFKSAWVSVVLHEGLNFPSDYSHLTSVKYINGSEIQWTLGAILYKTRFLPLREIQMQSLQAKNTDKSRGIFDILYQPFALMSHYPLFLILCITIAIFYVVISAIRFFLHLDRRKVASLRRVGSSVAYFVHEEV